MTLSDRTHSDHQHYGKPTLRPVRIGDEAVCAACGKTFIIGIVWAS